MPGRCRPDAASPHRVPAAAVLAEPAPVEPVGAPRLERAQTDRPAHDDQRVAPGRLAGHLRADRTPGLAQPIDLDRPTLGYHDQHRSGAAQHLQVDHLATSGGLQAVEPHGVGERLHLQERRHLPRTRPLGAGEPSVDHQRVTRRVSGRPGRRRRHRIGRRRIALHLLQRHRSGRRHRHGRTKVGQQNVQVGVGSCQTRQRGALVEFVGRELSVGGCALQFGDGAFTFGMAGPERALGLSHAPDLRRAIAGRALEAVTARTNAGRQFPRCQLNHRARLGPDGRWRAVFRLSRPGRPAWSVPTGRRHRALPSWPR